MAQQVVTGAAIEGYGATVEDVDLGALPVELGLGDVAALGEPL